MNKTLTLFRYIVILSLICFCGLSSAYAQDDWEDETGEIEDSEIVIEKDKQIELPPAQRLFEKIAPIPPKRSEGQVKFDLKDIDYRVSDIDPRIRVLTIKDPLLKKLYANYVKAGGGNYAGALLEAYINNKRNEKYSYGIHASHLSHAKGPVDKKNSASSQDYLGLNGKRFFDQYAVGAGLHYKNSRNYFYGYDQRIEVFRDTVEQKYTNFGGSVSLETRDTGGDFYFKLVPSYSYLKDNFEANERKFDIDFLSTFSLQPDLGFSLKSDLSIMSRRDGGQYDRKLFKIKPKVSFEAGQLKVNGGFNIVFESDTISDNKNVHLYLSTDVQYDLSEHVNLYAGIDGDIENVNLHTLSEENPWINAMIPLRNQNKKLQIFGGIKGNLFNSFTFNGGFSLSDYEDFYFFINDLTDSTRFSVLYEGLGTTKFNFFSEIGVDKTNVFKGLARYDFYAYDQSLVTRPWHLPSYKFTLMGSFNLFDKILFNTDFYTMGGIEAQDVFTGESIDLDPIVDLNFKIDYRYSDQVSMFLSFNNVLNKNYERYFGYPSRGFMVMGGLTYAFDKL